jgi:ribosomal protein S18 acetylase RimI-like enzyme
MEIDDLAPVFHLGERTFTSDIPNLYRMWDEYEVTNLFTTEPNLCLVAEDRRSGSVAGFAFGTTVTKTRSSWKYGYLVWMAVDEGYQKAGIGERLLRLLAARLSKQGARMLIIDTAADNEDALRFFEAEGFGHAQQHVYLSRNLDERRRRVRRKSE